MQRRRQTIVESVHQQQRFVQNSVVRDGHHKIAQLCGQQVAQFFLQPLREKATRVSLSPILVQENVGRYVLRELPRRIKYYFSK